jgi:hypothetical protein
MSALGQKQTLKRLRPMSALPPKADMIPIDRNGLLRCICLLLAQSGHHSPTDRHYLFFSAKKVQEVSVNLVVLDRARLEPIFTSDVSLLAPAKE